MLGFESLEDYLKHSKSCGITAGRYANRIAEGRFELDGKTYQLDRNFLGRHHLHGGHVGFGVRPWVFEKVSETAVVLSLVSPEGECGYPGTVNVRCTIELMPPSTMQIVYEAETSAPITAISISTARPTSSAIGCRSRRTAISRSTIP